MRDYGVGAPARRERRHDGDATPPPPTTDELLQRLIAQVQELVGAYHEQAAAFARLTERIDQLVFFDRRGLQ